MPTSSRLAAAICYAVLAWIVSGMVMAWMPERQEWGNFQPVNALIGLIIGWVVVGRRLRVDYVTAMGVGFTGMATTVFWCLFAHAFNEMLRLAFARRFDGPVEAIVAVFKITIEYATKLGHVDILVTLIVGGMLAGVIAEYVDRRWA